MKFIYKKMSYWTRGVHGYGINEYFSSKNIGDMGCLSGECDETDFDICFLEGTGLYHYDDVNLFWFDCAGGPEIIDKDGE